MLCAMQAGWATAQPFEALEVRLAEHPALAALAYQADASRQRGSAATALPDPVVSLEINNFPLYDPSFDTFLPTNKAVGVRQAIPSRAGREARARGARASAAEREARRAQHYAALRGELIQRLHHRQHRQHQLELLDEQDEKYDELRTVLEAEAGTDATALSRLAEVDAARAHLDQQRAEITERIARINARLRDLVGEVPQTEAPHLIQKDWSGDARQFHGVRVAEAAIGQAHAEVDAAEAAWRPDWGVELTYKQREAGRGGPRSTFQGDDWVSAQVTFSVPLWAGRKQAPKLRGAKMDRAAARARRLAAARQARADYEMFDATRLRAVAAIKAMREQIAAIEAQAQTMLTAYESGVGRYGPIINGEIAILKLRAQILAEQARKAEAIARMNALLVTR